MLIRNAFLTTVLALAAVPAMAQPWINPISPDCGPFQQQFDGATAGHCYFQGTFPWFAAGGGWNTVLRVAAPASGAIQVKFDFFMQNANNQVDPVILDITQTGVSGVTADSSYVFVLNPNQPTEVSLQGLHSEASSYGTSATGTVKVEVDCPTQLTCMQVMPQLIYSALPAYHWFLSGSLSTNVSLPSQTTSQIWTAVGRSDPAKSQFVSFVIFNDSGVDQTYTVTAFDQTGAQVGSNTAVGSGLSKGLLVHSFISNLPAGIIKLRVTGQGTCLFTALQFNGPAATALVPVAEVPLV